jgi:flagellar hook assembly protein FlgD
MNDVFLSVDPAADVVRFLNLGNNPLTRGDAIVWFGTPIADRIRVSVYDVSGRRVRRLADRLFAAGHHELRWDGADDRGRALPRGVYFTRLEYVNAGMASTRKVTVLK